MLILFLRTLTGGLLIFFSSLVFSASLQVSQSRSDDILLCIPVEKFFKLSFIHSVSLTPVMDVYKITDDNQILQIREDFITHGQGLPSMYGEPDATKFEITKDGYQLHLNRLIKQLHVRTDKRFQNKLWVKNSSIDLNQWPDTSLHIRIAADCTSKL